MFQNARTTATLIACATALLLPASVSHAQRASAALLSKDTTKSLEKDCAKAVKVLRTIDRLGQVHDDDEPGADAARRTEKRDAALTTLLACGGRAADAPGIVIRMARTVSDTAIVHAMIGPLRQFRDSSVFRAVLELARDRSATEAARVYAFYAAHVLVTGEYWLGYRDMLGEYDTLMKAPMATCGRNLSITDAKPFWYDGAPLPVDYREQVASIAKHVWFDSSEPMNVRAAASCAQSGPR